MKKIIIALAVCGSLFASSCKEKAPFIKLDDANYVDSPYTVTSMPATDPHNVLVEEFTGASCTNCPAAHETLTELENANAGRVNVIGLYINGVAQTQPPNGAKYDFRDATATTIGTAVYGGINQLPNGGIDRTLVSGNIQVSTGGWSSTISTQMAVINPLNLHIESRFNSVTGDNIIVANIVYTQAVATPQNLTVVIVEDSVVDYQEYPFFSAAFPDGLDTAYVFKNIFRQMITSPAFGDPILSSAATKAPLMALQRTFTYKLSSSVRNPDNCRVIAFVNSTNGSDYHVVQSCQVKLK